MLSDNDRILLFSIAGHECEHSTHDASLDGDDDVNNDGSNSSDGEIARVSTANAKSTTTTSTTTTSSSSSTTTTAPVSVVNVFVSALCADDVRDTLSASDRRLARFDLVDECYALETVLREVVRVLTPCNADARIDIFLRQRSFDSDGVERAYPFVESERRSDNAFGVNLVVRKSLLWCQNVFQFAHEFVHVLCAAGDVRTIRFQHANQWFEEAICHAGSLYALLAFDRALCAQLYGGDERVFEQYAAHEQGAPLARDESLGVWYRRHAATLRHWPQTHSAAHRALQGVVARWLLEHVGWTRLRECLRFINDEGRAALLSSHEQNVSLRRYLQRWRRSCHTAQQRRVVRKLARAFQPSEVIRYCFYFFFWMDD